MIHLAPEALNGIIAGVGIAATLGVYRVVRKLPKLCADKVREHIVEVVDAQFQPNGGSSMRDVVNEIRNGQKRLEAMVYLAASVQKNRLAFESFGSFEAGPDGRITWISDHYALWTARAASSLLRDGWNTVIAGEDRERVVSAWHSAVSTGTRFSMRYRMLNTDDESFWVRTKAYPIFSQDGEKLCGFSGITVRDAERTLTEVADRVLHIEKRLDLLTNSTLITEGK